MTITKTSENYSFEETLENGWKANGTLTKSDKNTNINFNISGGEVHENIGYYSWNKSTGVNTNYNVNKAEDESDFITAAQTIIAAVLAEA